MLTLRLVYNFSPRTQQVLALARREAARLNQGYVGTEHLLLGLLLLGQGVAFHALNSRGLDLEKGRDEVEKITGKGSGTNTSNVPYTARVKTVLALANTDAKALNHLWVGTEHILLGLLREEDGIPARVFQELNLDTDGIRSDVMTELKIASATSQMTWREKLQLLIPWRKPSRQLKLEFKLTPRAEQALILARSEADHFGHNCVGPEHLFLGLIKLGQGVSVNVLRTRGLDLTIARGAVEKETGTGLGTRIFESISYSPRLKKVLSLANNDARLLNHRYVGTEHMLLGILEEVDDVSARVFRELKIDTKGIRADVIKELSAVQTGQTGTTGSSSNGISPLLVVYCWFIYGAGGNLILDNLLWGLPSPNILDSVIGGLGYALSASLELIGHELSHTLVAYLVGFPILRITLGWPGKHFERSALGINWILDPRYIATAHVSYLQRATGAIRFKMWLTTAVGPLFNLGFFGISTLALYLFIQLEQPDSGGSYPLMSFLAGWCFQSAICLLGTFLAISPTNKGVVFSSDFKQLITIPFETEDEIRKNTIKNRVLLAHVGKAPALSDPEVQQLIDECPQTDPVLLFIVQHVNAGHDVMIDLWKRVLNVTLSKTEREYAIDGYLTYLLHKGSAYLEPGAEALCKELLEITDNSVTARGTKGSILVELNRLEEGKALLLEVIEETTSSVDLFYSHAFLSVAEKKLGNPALAESHRLAALQTNIDHRIAKSILARISQV